MKTNVTIDRKDGKMTTESLNTLCAALLKEYPSNTTLKAARSEICNGLALTESEWKTAVKEVQRLRVEGFKKDVKAAKTTAFDFDLWLKAGFTLLCKDSNFAKIYARWNSVKLKNEDLSDFVAKWYPFIQWDSNRTGYELLKPANLYRLDGSAEYKAQIFVRWDKTAKDAAGVLLKAFEDWSKAAALSILDRQVPRLNERETDTAYKCHIWNPDAIKWDNAAIPDDLTGFAPLNYYKVSGIDLPHTQTDNKANN